jgi:predicted nuclease of predicted toxin-antitoxin system
MIIWLDAQLSPAIALWLEWQFSLTAIPLRDLSLRDADDADIFFKAREAGAIIISKDSDFVDLITRFGSPPKIILLSCGNTSNDRLKEILLATLMPALKLLESGESVVEIRQ